MTLYTYTPPGGNTQEFETEAKRDEYAAWHRNLGAIVEQERQRITNNRDRSKLSARTLAEVAPLMGGENERINSKLEEK